MHSSIHPFVKEVSYAYPTSEYASVCGAKWLGCWALRVVDYTSGRSRLLSSHLTAVDAIDAGDALPEEWGRYSFQNVRDSYEQAATLSAQSCEVCATA